jgi:RNA polymerase sigma-70 factor (ECF subfamily)
MAGTVNTELVNRARKGEVAALEELIAIFRKPLLQYAIHYLGDEAEAEDVTQEVLLKAVKALPSFKGESSVSTWLYRIMTNACIDLRRKSTNRKTVYFFGKNSDAEETLVIDPADPLPLPEEQYELNEMRTVIQRALARLTPEHRTTLILHDLHGFKYQEIAAITKTGLGTVKSRLFYARQEMRRMLTNVLKRGEYDELP